MLKNGVKKPVSARAALKVSRIYGQHPSHEQCLNGLSPHRVCLGHYVILVRFRDRTLFFFVLPCCFSTVNVILKDH